MTGRKVHDNARLSEPRLIVFAKAPVLGTVKTRLAADIGAAQALACYQSMLSQTVERLRDGPWQLTLVVTPDASTGSDQLWPFGVAREPQGEGDLGQRMLRWLATATPASPVIIVGSDIPGIARTHVEHAVEQLTAADLVVGPATDGGYWLIGARRPVPDTLFQDVRWSTPHALAGTLANASGLAVAHAPVLDDLDTVADWRRWLASASPIAPSGAGDHPEDLGAG
jgi:uncharacterized protein